MMEWRVEWNKINGSKKYEKISARKVSVGDWGKMGETFIFSFILEVRIAIQIFTKH